MSICIRVCRHIHIRMPSARSGPAESVRESSRLPVSCGGGDGTRSSPLPFPLPLPPPRRISAPVSAVRTEAPSSRTVLAAASGGSCSACPPTHEGAASAQQAHDGRSHVRAAVELVVRAVGREHDRRRSARPTQARQAPRSVHDCPRSSPRPRKRTARRKSERPDPLSTPGEPPSRANSQNKRTPDPDTDFHPNRYGFPYGRRRSPKAQVIGARCSRGPRPRSARARFSASPGRAAAPTRRAAGPARSRAASGDNLTCPARPAHSRRRRAARQRRPARRPGTPGRSRRGEWWCRRRRCARWWRRAPRRRLPSSGTLLHARAAPAQLVDSRAPRAASVHANASSSATIHVPSTQAHRAPYFHASRPAIQARRAIFGGELREQNERRSAGPDMDFPPYGYGFPCMCLITQAALPQQCAAGPPLSRGP